MSKWKLPEVVTKSVSLCIKDANEIDTDSASKKQKMVPKFDQGTKSKDVAAKLLPTGQLVVLAKEAKKKHVQENTLEPILTKNRGRV